MFDLWFQPSDELKGALLTWVADMLQDQPIETFYSSGKLYKDVLNRLYLTLHGMEAIPEFDHNYFQFVSLLSKEITEKLDTLFMDGSFVIIQILDIRASKIAIKLEKVNDN